MEMFYDDGSDMTGPGVYTPTYGVRFYDHHTLKSPELEDWTDAVHAWCSERGYWSISNLAYFNSEEDRLIFLLRWS